MKIVEVREKITVRLPAKQVARLREEAKKRGIPLQDVLARAVGFYLSRSDRQVEELLVLARANLEAVCTLACRGFAKQGVTPEQLKEIFLQKGRESNA
jgi:hypothetical protein